MKKQEKFYISKAIALCLVEPGEIFKLKQDGEQYFLKLGVINGSNNSSICIDLNKNTIIEFENVDEIVFTNEFGKMDKSIREKIVFVLPYKIQDYFDHLFTKFA